MKSHKNSEGNRNRLSRSKPLVPERVLLDLSYCRHVLQWEERDEARHSTAANNRTERRLSSILTLNPTNSNEADSMKIIKRNNCSEIDVCSSTSLALQKPTVSIPNLVASRVPHRDLGKIPQKAPARSPILSPRTRCCQAPSCKEDQKRRRIRHHHNPELTR